MNKLFHLLFSIVFLLPGSLAMSADESPQKIVIHTDISIGLLSYGYDCNPESCPDCYHARDVDDAWAIAYLLSEPSVEVVAILVEFGNAFCFDPCNEECDPNAACQNLDEMVAWVEQLVAWSGKDVQVFEGSRCPFDVNRETPAGTQQVLNLLRKTGPATILGIGNAADPAYMVRDLNISGEIDLIDRLILEMGYWGEWYGKPSFMLEGKAIGDANALNDQGSISWLIEQSILPPIEFVPYNAVRLGLVSPAILDAMKIGEGPVSSLLASQSEDWLIHWGQVFDDYQFHLWDVVAALSILDGSDFASHDVSPFMQEFSPIDAPAYLTLQLAPAEEVTGFVVRPTISSFGPPLLPNPVKVNNDNASSDCNVITQLALLGASRLDAISRCRTDTDGNGVTDIDDILAILENWGTCF